MVKGLDKFREHFSAYADRYVLIGGVAADLVMREAGVPFRATKDLDIVLNIEALDADFVQVFWGFVKEGGYQHQQKSTGEKQYYRFTNPAKKDFPVMLELFARNPDNLVLGDESHLAPIPVDEDLSSLSAILMDEDYYRFIHEHTQQIYNISVVSEVCLIPLKAKAWLDMSQRRDVGEDIDSKNIRKHRNDVFRLFQILSPELRISLPESINADMRTFLQEMNALGEEISLRDLGLGEVSVDEILGVLMKVYEMHSV